MIKQYDISLAMLRVERERRIFAKACAGATYSAIDEAKKEVALFTKSVGEWINLADEDHAAIEIMFKVWAESRPRLPLK